MFNYNNQTYKVVVTTPAGREKYLSIFKNFIYRKMEEGLVDSWQLWQNTVNPADIAYLASMAAENPKVKVYTLDEAITPTWESYNAMQTHKFSKFAMEDDTIYIRFDDDIIWCEEGALEKIVKARIDCPNALYIYPNVINSTWVTSMHQEIGALSEEAGSVKRYNRSEPDRAYLDEFNYSNSGLYDLIQTTFQRRYNEKSLSAYYLPSKSLDEYQRFSICCVAWWGKDHLQVADLEEEWISWGEPARRQRPNFFVGNALLVHFAYHTQRPYQESSHPEYLQFFKEITK